MIVSAKQDNNYEDDRQSRSMIDKGVPQPSDAPSVLGHSSSTAVKKLSQPTEQKEERNRDRKIDDDENNKLSDEDEAAKLAADSLFRSILDKALGKEKD